MKGKLILSSRDIYFKHEIYARGKNLILTIQDGYITICEKGQENYALSIKYQDLDNKSVYLSELIQKIVN